MDQQQDACAYIDGPESHKEHHTASGETYALLTTLTVKNVYQIRHHPITDTMVDSSRCARHDEGTDTLLCERKVLGHACRGSAHCTAASAQTTVCSADSIAALVTSIGHCRLLHGQVCLTRVATSNTRHVNALQEGLQKASMVRQLLQLCQAWAVATQACITPCGSCCMQPPMHAAACKTWLTCAQGAWTR